jgi:hypothetical protein
MFPDITPLIKGMAFLLTISIPLALWKVIEILIWLFRHISISLN